MKKKTILLCFLAAVLPVAPGCTCQRSMNTEDSVTVEPENNPKADREEKEAEQTTAAQKTDAPQQHVPEQSASNDSQSQPLPAQKSADAPTSSTSSESSPGGTTSAMAGEGRIDPPKSKRDGSATSAAGRLRAAQSKSEQAKRHAAQGAYAAAYREALEGWKQANQGAKHDRACAACAAQLLEQLQIYGEAANRQGHRSGAARRPSNDKPIQAR